MQLTLKKKLSLFTACVQLYAETNTSRMPGPEDPYRMIPLFEYVPVDLSLKFESWFGVP